MTDVLLPLALLYADDCREIRGATKFQKLAFLAQEEYGVEELHEFEPDKYGPFSESLAGAVKALEQKGVIKKRREQVPGGDEMLVYSLTERGANLAEELLGEEDGGAENTLTQAQKVKGEWGQAPVDTILRHVYQSYSEYTSPNRLRPAKGK